MTTQAFHLQEALWQKLARFIPQTIGQGRRSTNDKGCFEALLYMLKTGCQYAHLPKVYQPKSTVHNTYKRWVERGILHQLYQALLLEYDDVKGLDWEWLSADASIVKAPLGGSHTGKKSDRSFEVRL
jgi:putative transposase